ncbi:hypothetical protein [Paenibacillus sp. FSL R7-0331]|uniref:hypothetical protein n=1 Tax=Paenibacillus sp. FSL R7-0331 TaxID=1536773 RepID=UPI000693B9C0|nr:hypothetical protein [Paenibacillus sp. FSL R7-0331]
MNDEWSNGGLEGTVQSVSAMSMKASEGLTIQDSIRMLQSARSSADGRVPGAEHLDEQRVFTAIKEAVLNAETLYIAYDVHTNYPYIGSGNQVWVFSEDKFAAEAADYYLQQLIQLEMRRLGREDILKMLAELHVLGIGFRLDEKNQRMVAEYVRERDA